MKSHYLLLILLFLVIGHLHGLCQADTQYASSARNISLGNAGVSISGTESMIYNPAGITSVQDWGISVTAESRFVLVDLTTASMTIIKKIDGYGAFGAVISNFGIDEYKQQKYGLTYARLFTKSLSFGVQFNYFMTQIDDYGSKGRFGLAGGLKYNLSKHFQFGVSTSSYVQDLNGEDNGLDSRIGLSYQPGEKVWLYTDFSFSNASIRSLHLGLEYALSQEVIVRLGTQTRPALFSVGIGYTLNQNYRIDGATSSHQNLGMTPAASLLYEN